MPAELVVNSALLIGAAIAVNISVRLSVASVGWIRCSMRVPVDPVTESISRPCDHGQGPGSHESFS